MPPTDTVKRLSRTDLDITNIKHFLKLQGVIVEGNENVIANPLPYTAVIPVKTEVSSDSVHMYKCLATSVCTQLSAKSIASNREIRYGDLLIESREKIDYVITDNKLHIFDANNVLARIICKTKIRKAGIVFQNLRTVVENFVDKSPSRYAGVQAIYIEMGRSLLSIASADPIVIESRGSHVIELFIPKSELAVFSLDKGYAEALRNSHVYKHLALLKDVAIRSAEPIVEIIDPISVVSDVVFYNGCVDMTLVNITPMSFNSMIKVHGYIDEIVVDEMAKFKPRYSIVRLAMPSYGRSKVRLCVSTAIPRRADMALRFLERLSRPGQLFDGSE